MTVMTATTTGTITAEEFQLVRKLVFNQSAIVLDDGKEYLVEARLLPLARRQGLRSITDLLARLKSDGNGLHRQVVEAMATNETSFFRDERHFGSLKQRVLPELLRTRAERKQLNLWSAACSTGQEPYSIAMLVREQVLTQPGWSARILATDFSSEVIARAREARYSQLEVNRGLTSEALEKHFTPEGRDWRLDPQIRQMVEFRPLNLVERFPPLPPMDVIFLRNVLIYFDMDTKRGVLSAIRQQLQPDGFLFLGGAETPLNLDDAFEQAAPAGEGAFYRLRDRE